MVMEVGEEADNVLGPVSRRSAVGRAATGLRFFTKHMGLVGAKR